MFIIFLGIFPIMALAFCCWYCCRDRQQRTQLWAKIMGGPKLSLPYVFISSIVKKICTFIRNRFISKTLQPIFRTPSASVANRKSVDIISIEKNCVDINYAKRAEEQLQNADDPSHGAKEKKVKERKKKDIHLEVITVQSSPKMKVKSFGVASERLITEHVDISPISSPEIRSASCSPKFSRRANESSSSKREPKRDFRDWVKDRVHLKLPNFMRSFSRDGTVPKADPCLEGVATDPVETIPSLPQLLITPAEATPNSPIPVQDPEVSASSDEPSAPLLGSPKLRRPPLPPPLPPPMPPKLVFN